MTVELQSPTRKQLGVFADRIFTAIGQDLGERLSQPLSLLEAVHVEQDWPQLLAHFAAAGAFIEFIATDLEDGRFRLLLDQRAAYLLTGSLLSTPDADLVARIEAGEAGDELQSALDDLGATLQGAIARSLEGLELGTGLSVAEARWAVDLLQAADPAATHLRAIYTFRGTRLLLLVTLPPALLALLAQD